MTKNNKKKCVCFVTGVPGAGKTLVGLDVVSRNIGTSRSVYLSGNGPLVEVLREALLRSSREKLKQFKDDEDFNKKIKLNDASIKALIQSSFSFKKDNVSRGEPTSEHIIIFDFYYTITHDDIKDFENVELSQSSIRLGSFLDNFVSIR